MKVLVTGRPGCGKTTLCEKLVALMRSRGKMAGGVLSKEIRKDGARVGFKLIDIATGNEGILAHVSGSGPEVGKYRVNLRDIESVGVSAIGRASEAGMFVVIDEIGPMELYSAKFVDAVERAFESGLDILATVHYRSNHPLIEHMKRASGTELFVLDESNREKVFEEIAKRLKL